MKVNPNIFKAYDIRGIYPDELNEKTIYKIGRAIILYTKAETIAVGRDMRQSSSVLEQSLIKGITDQGASVIKTGLCPTPLIYFASWKLKVDAAIVITASHNPAQYNGLKICLKNAIPIGEGSGMEEIKEFAMAERFPIASKKGEVKQEEAISDEYVKYLAGFYKQGAIKKIVIDFANGMGIIDKKVYEKLSNKIKAVYLFDVLDGSFPNHEANPIKAETLEALKKRVVEEKADLGIAYDGDADRVGFVSEEGEIIPMDYLIALLAKEILKKRPGALILMDLRSSNAVKEEIERAGGRVNLCRVGHSLIKKQMRDQGAIFAGELSGHYFFQENSKAEMATLAAIMVINLMNQTGQKISQLIKDLKRYYHSGEMNSDVRDKTVVIKKLKEIYGDGKLNELDGIRIDYPDWWFNVRPSNTEPKLRLNLEAKTKELMEEKRDELLKIIRQ